MGFEDYQVMLTPRPVSVLASGGTPRLVEEIAAEIRQTWPAFVRDEWEVAHLDYPKRPDEVFLVYDTPREIFQMCLGINTWQNDPVDFSLRFAYCNPRTIYEPFCAVVEGLMERYNLICHPMRDLGPLDETEDQDICSPADVRRLLVPSMNYNRRLWFLDAQTTEEAALRPKEAIARFIVARLQTLQKEPVGV